MKRRCTDLRCQDCFPEAWDPPPDEMGWGWPYLTLGLILLAVFAFFVALWMTQGGAFRPEMGG